MKLHPIHAIDLRLTIQCKQCRGFSIRKDAVETDWKCDLDAEEAPTYYCGVCQHELKSQNRQG